MTMGLFAGASLFAISCTDDINVSDGIINKADSGLTLLIPNVDGAAQFGMTRDDHPTRAQEAMIGVGEAAFKEGDLHLLAFDSKGTRHYVNLYFHDKTTTDTHYSYVINLPEDNYRCYVLANINEYIDGNVENSLQTEDKVKELILNFADIVKENNNILLPGNLPMACLASEINGGNQVKLGSNQSATVTAYLKFLCSKVRYTILYDGIENEDKANEIGWEFNTPFANNLRMETALTSERRASNDVHEKMENLQLYKANYPKEENSPYFNIKNQMEPPAPLDKKDDNDNWTDSDYQRAWQGVVYLPENLKENDTDFKETSISFPASNRGLKKEKTFKLIPGASSGIERGKMYDVVAKLQSDKMTFTFNVTDWELQTLAYQLHGPYELVVEETELKVVYSGKWTPLRFKSDVPDDDISFEFPVITIDNNETRKVVPFYIAQVINPETTDEEGNPYEYGDWPSILRIQVNPEIPYSVLSELKKEENKEEVKNLLGYFHVVAGNIHKKIDIEMLSLEPFLIVSPTYIPINTRTQYMSGNGDYDVQISFRTNYDNTNSSVNFYILDPSGLYTGLRSTDNLTKTADLKLAEGEVWNEDGNPITGFLTSDTSDTDKIHISITNGIIDLQIRNIFEGHSFWSEEKEFKIKFILEAPDLKPSLEEEVTIKIIPFITTYTIHFKDNTKHWERPHIFVYQDLTLPSDLTKYKPGTPEYIEEGNEHEISPNAGKIVGYIENNIGLNLQWNAATQYVFSNNIAFRGWTGYGGPEGNDPWADGECNYNVADNLTNQFRSTMGFFMFGQPSDLDHSWNFEYSYQKENKDNRDKHYRYDVNFNEEHEEFESRWRCPQCLKLKNDRNHDYNFLEYIQYEQDEDPDGRGYPGISMAYEEEEDGWWKYTLTGVAQPGTTMLFFANWHEPWREYKAFANYVIEDYRFPGDYESGLPLFDYENNEAWFLFDGNGTNTDQHFSNTKPLSRTVTLKQDMLDKMRIEIMKPSNGKNITKIVFNEPAVIEHQGNDGEDNEWNYPATYPNNKDYGFLTPPTTNNRGQTNEWNETEDGLKFYINPALNNSKFANMLEAGAFSVRLIFNNDDTDYMEYELAPKNFDWINGEYATIDPLRFEFIKGMPMLIKWSDNIKMGKITSGEYGWTYQPYPTGCNWMNVYWEYGTEEQSMGVGSASCTPDKEIGNYKHVDITTNNPPSSIDKSKLYLVLGSSAWSCQQEAGHQFDKFSHTLKIEDMPKFYNPDHGKYIINWHMLRPGHYRPY